MQQTKSYWLVVAVAGVLGAIVASACTVTTSSDDSSGGTGTIAGTGGTSIAGTTSTGGGGATATGGSSGSTSIAGTTSTGGSGGAATTTFQCDPADGNPVGTPASCAATAGNGCSTCIAASCCTEFGQCFATSPGNQCGYGGPKGDGQGEFICAQACIQTATSDGGVLDASTIETCANGCVTPKDSANKTCEMHVGQQTNDLIACVNMNCQAECFGG